ncbi:hypothetical protein BS78_09G139200 [Paspalum vaginatum]|nr:hypothetical protein BS78_09G139200 [Paspalum vaginatum]
MAHFLPLSYLFIFLLRSLLCTALTTSASLPPAALATSVSTSSSLMSARESRGRGGGGCGVSRLLRRRQLLWWCPRPCRAHRQAPRELGRAQRAWAARRSRGGQHHWASDADGEQQGALGSRQVAYARGSTGAAGEGGGDKQHGATGEGDSGE